MRVLLAVEGPHDLEVVARLLKNIGFARNRLASSLPPDLKSLVPTRFPYRDDLLARVPVPVFLSRDATWVAVQAHSDVITLLKDVRIGRPTGALDAIAAIADADSQPASVSFARLASKWRASLPDLPCPTLPGVVTTTTPRAGIYVSPDCAASGTLEDLIIESGQEHYKELLGAAESYVARASTLVSLSERDKEELANAGSKKAQLGAAAAILKPGKAIQVSIHDNRWIGDPPLAGRAVRHLAAFVDALLVS